MHLYATRNDRTMTFVARVSRFSSNQQRCFWVIPGTARNRRPSYSACMRCLRLAFAVLALAIGGGRARGEQEPAAPDPHAPSLPDADDSDDGPALHAQIEALRTEVRE